MWSHSETHLLYVAEKKRPKTCSFFETESPELSGLGDEVETLKADKKDSVIKVGLGADLMKIDPG